MTPTEVLQTLLDAWLLILFVAGITGYAIADYLHGK